MLTLNKPHKTSKMAPSSNKVGVASLLKQIHDEIQRKHWFGNEFHKFIVREIKGLLVSTL